MRPKNWTIVGLTTLALTGVTGMAFAADGISLNDRTDPITLDQADDSGTTDAPTTTIDMSPESADSPAESPFDSVESATDSPDDPGYIDPSPESADSPGRITVRLGRVGHRQPG